MKYGWRVEKNAIMFHVQTSPKNEQGPLRAPLRNPKKNEQGPL